MDSKEKYIRDLERLTELQDKAIEALKLALAALEKARNDMGTQPLFTWPATQQPFSGPGLAGGYPLQIQPTWIQPNQSDWSDGGKWTVQMGNSLGQGYNSGLQNSLGAVGTKTASGVAFLQQQQQAKEQMQYQQYKDLYEKYQNYIAKVEEAQDVIH